MTNQELQKLVEIISLEIFHKAFLHEATFNNRLRTTGGRYLLKTSAIEINPAVFSLHGMEELDGVIRHELCHYHLHREGKGYKHRDADFRNLLKVSKAPRFCSMLIERKDKSEKKIHLYKCTFCGLDYKRKIKMNVEKYVCGKCSGRLQYVSEKS
ncbi:SprT family protein [Paenisporosarcina cavernae]|uniref:SprT family protein n=1 Tax=Paenisporosarcina cavernae TaxID=2320858 RepID=A0A385YXM0_9BACL|nr:SprT family protein [Paenisporosarcina cavernae]AYC30348.1 SprT family protein [Paenisporosarcina cavernae]